MICMNDMNYKWYVSYTVQKRHYTVKNIKLIKPQLMTYIAADYHARAENVLDSCWRDVQF